MMPELNQLIESIPEAFSIFINQIVCDKKLKGERVYTFSLGEAFFDIPRFEIEESKFISGYHYSSSMGLLKLRNKIGKLYKDYYGANINSANEIIISAGSKPIIFMILMTVLNPLDEVIVHEPAWLSYKEQIKLAGGVHVPVPYNQSIENWEKYINNKTKAIIINNPNNPSGKLYSREELEYLFGLAKKYNLFIISDEAYSDFLMEKDKFISFAIIDKDREHSLIVNSLSKNMGMSGWRVGYAIGHERVLKQLLKLNQHLITCAPTLLQEYMADHFEDILAATIPQARGMAEKRNKVRELMNKIGIKALEGEGTFYFLVNVADFPGTTNELVYDLLLKHNIAVVPGEAYGTSTTDFVRFGIGVENLEDIERCLKIVKGYLNMDKYDNSILQEEMRTHGII